MAIRFRCQSCSGLMSISSRKAGSMVQCPTCGQPTPVPYEDVFDAAEARAPQAPLPESHSPETVLSPVPPPPPEWPVMPREPDRVDETGDRGDGDFVPAEFAVVEFATEESAAGEPVAEEPAAAESRAMESAGDDFAAEEPGGDEEPPALQLRRRNRIDDEMDLTPMVDVTFQLLIFFMVTASFALQKSIEVPTPDPERKGAAQQLQILEDLEGSSIRVQIDAANAILIDDEPVGDPARLPDVLKDKMRREQKTEMLISASAAALHRSVISVIDAANSVGMQKIRLVARQGKSE